MDLFDLVINDFKNWVTSDTQCKALWQKVENGTADYKDADKYSKLVGKWWGDELNSQFSDKDYADYATEIAKSLKKSYSESSYYSKNVQNNLNKKSKIGMKAIEPKIDDSRIANLLEKLVKEEADFLLKERVIQNITKQAVSDTINANARVQNDAGLETLIIRHEAQGGCCKWCASLSGEYKYGQQPNDVFAFHDDCGCWVEYKVSKSKLMRAARNTDNIKTTVY